MKRNASPPWTWDSTQAAETRQSAHIYDRISAEITAYLGEDRVNAAGLKIYTTLDRKLQEATGKSLEQAPGKH